MEWEESTEKHSSRPLEVALGDPCVCVGVCFHSIPPVTTVSVGVCPLLFFRFPFVAGHTDCRGSFLFLTIDILDYWFHHCGFPTEPFDH